ncbi:hypothetical protein [Sideroxydans lithotrophicus]|uniref:Uncharacterized protein n=1 Tax=Sideroxydans lithotrophicus (strain ES-1) TaxID=580332 RepID=D5CS55_SIDLE|nr:hypothetical protein [Sideroxydans lithotrophicus]ADE11791.1 conserved hypothetical protein [Sideroxydans lithotrophicus ES-1]
MTKTTSTVPVHRLALRVHEIAQLFNSMDPTPFLNKDLDPQANEYIESWASTHPLNSRLQLTIHLELWPEDGDPTSLLTEAIHNHFIYQAERTRRKLRQVLKQGRISMAIGLIFVSICLIAADYIGDLGPNAGYRVARESLTIVGWVAMWRPLQIFLYDWWPILRKIRLYLKLGSAHVQVVQGK